jgi:hypothetical protein
MRNERPLSPQRPILNEPRQAADMIRMAMGDNDQIDFNRDLLSQDIRKLLWNRRSRTATFEIARVGSIDQNDLSVILHDDAVTIFFVADIQHEQLHFHTPVLKHVAGST